MQAPIARTIIIVVLLAMPLSAQAQSPPPLRELAALPHPLARATAIWDGSSIYVFGGQTASGPTDEILKYDPSTDTWVTMETRLPLKISDLSAVWTGTEALIFGYGEHIMRYDPRTDHLGLADSRLPSARSGSSAVWTGAAAYVIGGGVGPGRTTDEIVEVKPGTGLAASVSVVAHLPAGAAYTAAIWTGRDIAIHGGQPSTASPTGDLVIFDPTSRTVSSPGGSSPDTWGMSGIWDGTHGYLFAGEHSGGWHVAPMRYTPNYGGERLNAYPLPGGERGFTAAVWTGTVAYVIGGENRNGPVATLVEVTPSRLPGGVSPTRPTTPTTPRSLPTSDPRLPLDVTWWAPRDWRIEGAASSCAYTDFRGDEHVVTSGYLTQFEGTISGFDPRTGAPLHVTSDWGLVVNHGSSFGYCNSTSVTTGGQAHDGLGFAVAMNFSSAPEDARDIFSQPLGPGTLVSASGRAVACTRLAPDTIAIAGFSGEIAGRNTSVPGDRVPGVTARSSFSGNFDLIVARPVTQATCDTNGVAFTGGNVSTLGYLVALRSASANGASPVSTTPPAAQPSPTARTPCYDLLSCPVGDVSSIRSRILGVRGQIVSAAGVAVAGAPLLLLAEKDGALDLLSITQTLSDGSFSIPTTTAPPAYAATLMGGHVVLADLASQAGGVPSDGLLSLKLPVPDAAAAAQHSQLSAPELELLADAFNTAKPFGVPSASPDAPANIPINGYAGIRGVAVRPTTPQQDARLVVVEMKDKGSPRIPDPPGGPRAQYFAMQLADLAGKDVPVQRIEFEFEAPPGSEGKDVKLHHFLLDEQRWETVDARKNDVGTFSAGVDSLSLFAISTSQPSALGALVTGALGSPLALPILGGILVIGIAAVALNRARAVRGPKRAPPGAAPTAIRAQPLPEREAIVSDLSVSAKGTQILKDVSFAFGQGEILALLGPSGSGKSTLLKALLGETRFSGEASLFGIDPSRPTPEHKKLVGYVSQETELYPDMTLRENVEYFGKQYGLSGAELKARVGPLLDTLGLSERAQTRVGLLSGGQQRRASIAATLVHGPSLLILDEPTSGLDPVTRKSLWKFIRQASRELGVTVIVTTHFLDEADLADRVVILNKGAVVRAGTPQELVRSLPGGGKAVIVELQSTSPAIEARVREAVRPLESRGVIAGSDLSGYTARFFTANAQAASRELLDVFGHADVPVKQVTTEDCGMDAVFTFYAGERWRETDA